jgi:hypothetical protein
MAINNNKAAKEFVQIYDNFLSDKWCNQIYDYAVSKGRPWGVYVSTEDVLNDAISTTDVFQENPERAFSLEAVRAYYAQKGAYFLHEDSSRIHGIEEFVSYPVFLHGFHMQGVLCGACLLVLLTKSNITSTMPSSTGRLFVAYQYLVSQHSIDTKPTLFILHCMRAPAT